MSALPKVESKLNMLLFQKIISRSILKLSTRNQVQKMRDCMEHAMVRSNRGLNPGFLPKLTFKQDLSDFWRISKNLCSLELVKGAS